MTPAWRYEKRRRRTAGHAKLIAILSRHHGELELIIRLHIHLPVLSVPQANITTIFDHRDEIAMAYSHGEINLCNRHM